MKDGYKTKAHHKNKLKELRNKVPKLESSKAVDARNSKDVKKDDIDQLLDYLTIIAEQVSRKRYGNPKEIFELAKTNVYPKKINELAESFGMMIVKVEARELRLTKAIDKLKKINKKLQMEIDERKIGEKTIQIYSDIFNNADLGLCVCQMVNIDKRKTFKLITANPAFMQINKLSMKDIQGKPFEEILPELCKLGILNILEEVIRSSRSIELGDICFEDKKGTQDWFLVKTFPLSSNFVCISFDNITKVKSKGEI